jgi:hypothetical protein
MRFFYDFDPTVEQVHPQLFGLRCCTGLMLGLAQSKVDSPELSMFRIVVPASIAGQISMEVGSFQATEQN